jgi:hypothetical protein
MLLLAIFLLIFRSTASVRGSGDYQKAVVKREATNRFLKRHLLAVVFCAIVLIMIGRMQEFWPLVFYKHISHILTARGIASDESRVDIIVQFNHSVMPCMLCEPRLNVEFRFNTCMTSGCILLNIFVIEGMYIQGSIFWFVK